MMESNEDKLARLEKTTSALIEHIKAAHTSTFKVLETMNAQLTTIEAEITIIRTKVDHLDGNTNTNFGKVNKNLGDLKTEIQKINNVTGYKDLFDNQKNLGNQA